MYNKGATFVCIMLCILSGCSSDKNTSLYTGQVEAVYVFDMSKADPAFLKDEQLPGESYTMITFPDSGSKNLYICGDHSNEFSKWNGPRRMAVNEQFGIKTSQYSIGNHVFRIRVNRENPREVGRGEHCFALKKLEMLGTANELPQSSLTVQHF